MGNIINNSWYTSNDPTWETPLELFNKLNDVYEFDTDVCAVEKTAKCEHYYSPEINGLAQSWSGICWMNPPYGKEQAKWITKAIEETEKVGGVQLFL